MTKHKSLCKFRAFSLIELLIGLIIISVAMAAFAPMMSKRAEKQKAATASKLTTLCPDRYGGRCLLCYTVGDKKCITCSNECRQNECLSYQNCTCSSANCSGTN